MKIRTSRWWVLGLAVALTGCGTTKKDRRPPDGSYSGGTSYSAAATPVLAVAEESRAPAGAPRIYANSAILIDASTGQTVWQKNADQRRQVASTQKLLTALLVAERGNLDGPATVQAIDTRAEPSKLYLRAGDSYTRRKLLTAMMVKSCNDVAALLARDHSGSVGAFTEAMNRKAMSLGARSSHFVNPHGLPGAQYSTARDMSRVAFAAYRNPDLRSMMRLRGYTFQYANGKTKFLEATNKLLRRSPSVNGMKTGYTVAAGRCLITSATVGGKSLILVQLGSKTRYIFNDAERMMRWGFGQDRGGQLAAR